MPNQSQGKGFSFNLEGLEAMYTALDNALDEIDQRVDDKLTKLALHIISDAKKLAGLDEGDLEAALIVGEVKRLIGLSYIDMGTSPEVNHYAVAQHEGLMKRNGKIIPFTPGEKTRSKPAHGGYMPGKKFLENALKMNEKLIIEELSKVLGVRLCSQRT